MSVGGLNPTQSGTGFLSFNSLPPRLHITADDEEFDERTIQHWRDEGFDVTYFPCVGSEKAFVNKLKSLSDDLELGETYALVAYGHAAALALHTHIKPQAHLTALIAYYPDQIPSPNAKYPSQLRVVCHIAGSQPFSPAFKSYRYSATKPGFAEYDLDEYDKVAARLSWTRSLEAVRKGFKKEVDLESPLEQHISQKFIAKNAAATVATMVPDAFVNNVPTMTGGIGQKDLYRFYKDFFSPSVPPSMNIRLISRTIGADRAVDEMFVSLRHTQEIPWLLPGVPPTNKQVEIVLVSIVTIRGGKLVSENMYWDQASVLVQAGLLDPNLVPDALKSKGLRKLPVAGREAARKVLDEESQPSNDMIPKWSKAVNGNGKLPIRNASSQQARKGGPA